MHLTELGEALRPGYPECVRVALRTVAKNLKLDLTDLGEFLAHSGS